jgi:DNA-binding response OmpR family regulator
MDVKNINKTPRVLIVDDDEMIPFALIHFSKLFEVELEIVHAGDIGEAVDRLNEKCFDAAVLDVRLPGVTGISLGALVREYDVNLPLAYLTNLDTEAVRVEAAAQGAIFLQKLRWFGEPDQTHVLLKIIRELAKRNPCLNGEGRLDNHGFPRLLKATPIELPGVLKTLLGYSRSMAAAA